MTNTDEPEALAVSIFGLKQEPEIEDHYHKLIASWPVVNYLDLPSPQEWPRSPYIASFGGDTRETDACIVREQAENGMKPVSRFELEFDDDEWGAYRVLAAIDEHAGNSIMFNLLMSCIQKGFEKGVDHGRKLQAQGLLHPQQTNS